MENSSRDYYLVSLRVNGCYFWFNMIQICLTLLILVALFLNQLELTLILEVLITFLIGLDLILRYFSQGAHQFVNNIENKINLLLFFLLVSSIFVNVVYPQKLQKEEETIAFIFVMLRYSLQIIRLAKLIVESKTVMEISGQQQINLSDHTEDDSIEHLESTNL